MRYKLLFTCLLLIVMHDLSANGGGIAFYGVNQAGNPYFKNFPKIEILREDLLIRLIDDRIEVRVAYLMNNTSAQNIEGLHYAFPVDFWSQRQYKESIDGTYTEIPANSEKEMNEAIKYVEFICNGKPLKYDTQPPIRDEGDYYAEHSYRMRAWYFTTVDLPKGVSQLIVKYSLKSGSQKESGDMFELANFYYDFSPAGTFGDAKIKEFAITVDATYLTNNEVEFGNGSYLFEQQGKVYTYNQLDFDLKQSKPLNISFSHQNIEPEILINRIPANDLVIRASSATSQYPVSKLTDLDFGSAFVFGKNGGIGEWIEITTKNKTKISAIRLLPGYYKSEKAYYDNNRIKKVLVEYFSCRGEVMYTEEIEFQDIPYQKLNYSNFNQNTQYLFGIEYDYFDPVDSTGNPIDDWMPGTVKITILEVYPGEKFNDTCISEMFVI